MSTCQATTLEDVQNFNNWNKAIDVPVSRRKRFLARKIHKLKKILKLGSKAFRRSNRVSDLSLEEWQNHQNSIEEQMQNYENEKLEKKFMSVKERSYEHDQNTMNENWENWDSSCYMCHNHDQSPPDHYQPYGSERDVAQNSICYVFMPGQVDPVPVKLRNAKIPGGVMWIVYRPDADICARDNLYSFTSSQIPQAQRPILV